MVDDDVLFRFRLRLFSLAAGAGQRPRGLPHLRASTAPPTTAGGGRSCAAASRCSGPASAGRRGCPTRRASSSSSGSWPSASATPGWVRGASAPRSPRSAGAASSSAPTACGGSSRRHGLSRRVSRLSLVAGYAAPPGARAPVRPSPSATSRSTIPGELVGFDCFHVGRLSGTSGRVWQYTAIDLATSLCLGRAAHDAAEPRRAATRARLARRVAADLARHGWRLERVLTDIQSGWAFASHAAGRPWKDAEVRLPSAIAQSPIGALVDSWPVDHAGGRGHRRRTDRPVGNLVTTTEPSRLGAWIPVSECLVPILLVRRLAAGGESDRTEGRHRETQAWDRRRLSGRPPGEPRR